MESFDITKLLVVVIAAFLGSFLSHLAAWRLWHMQKKREQLQETCQALKDIFLLRQDLYDGHKREISKLNKSTSSTTSKEWLDARDHPSRIMSELRMLVGMYANRSLGHELAKCAEVHIKLKKLYDTVDSLVESGNTDILLDQENRSKANELQKEMGIATLELREKITFTFHKLRKPQA